MTWVYGNQIEPGGMALDDDYDECKCPDCGAPARLHCRDQVEGGSINTYETVSCAHCGHRSGDDGTP